MVLLLILGGESVLIIGWVKTLSLIWGEKEPYCVCLSGSGLSLDSRLALYTVIFPCPLEDATSTGGQCGADVLVASKFVGFKVLILFGTLETILFLFFAWPVVNLDPKPRLAGETCFGFVCWGVLIRLSDIMKSDFKWSVPPYKEKFSIKFKSFRILQKKVVQFEWYSIMTCKWISQWWNHNSSRKN